MTEIEAHRKMIKFCTFVKTQELSAKERLTMTPLKVIKEVEKETKKETKRNIIEANVF